MARFPYTALAVGLVGSALAVAYGSVTLPSTPPRLWSTWYSLNATLLNASALEATVDRLVSSGMQAAGYATLIIDDGWQASTRTASGELLADATKFPLGMAATVQYARAQNISVGLYTTPGNFSCLDRPASYGHTAQDIALWVTQWGVRYIKDCVCGTTHELRTHAYTDMAAILANTDAQVMYECDPFMEHPWTWARGVCSLWAAHDDIADTFDSWTSALDDLAADNVSAGAGPGSYALPDILRIGEGGQTMEEYQAQISMYAVLAAPLICGTDLRRASPDTIRLYTDPNLLRLHGDPLGAPGFRVAKLVAPEVNFVDIWRKALAGGRVALGILNLGNATSGLLLDLNQLAGFPAGQRLEALNVWTQESIAVAGPFPANLNTHQALLLELTPSSVDAQHD